MIKNFSEVSYYHKIKDDHIVLGNGDIVIGYNLILPEIWTLNEQTYENYYQALITLLKSMPENATVHFQTNVYDDEYKADLSSGKNRIEIEDLKSWDERPVVRMYQRLFITLSNEAMKEISETNNPLQRGLAYLKKRPFKNISQLIADYEQTVNTIEKTLEHNRYVGVSRMDSEELRSAVHGHLDQSYDMKSQALDKVNSDLHFQDGHIKIGNEYVAVISLRKEGDSLVSSKETHISKSPFSDVDLPDHLRLPWSMSGELTVGIPFPHTYNVAIEKVNQENAFDELKKIKANVRLFAFFGEGKAVRLRDEVGGMKDNTGQIISNGFIDQVENYDFQVTRCRVNIVVKDPSMEVLRDKVNYVINTFATMNDSVAAVENGHALNLFMASSPGCMRFNYRYLWHIANQSVMYIPKEGMYSSDYDGLRFVDRLGHPLTINNWKNKHIVNRNAVVFAPSGSGKSVLLNHQVNQYIAQGYYVIIIDIGGSYKRNTKINKGYYFDAGVPENLRFNIFLCDRDKQGNFIYMPEEFNDQEDKEEEPSRKDDQLNFVLSMLLKIWKGNEPVSKELKAALKQSIVDFYEYVNANKLFPDMKVYYEFLSEEFKSNKGEKLGRYFDIDGLLLVLEEYVTGQYSELLNSRENVKLSDQKFLVFDLEAIKDNEEISELVIAIVMYYASEIITKKQGRKVYVVDEAIDYLKGDMGDFIAGLYRKIRKRNGKAVISTQGIGYLNELDALTQKSIFGNTSTVWLLSHKDDKGSYPLLQENLDLTDSDLEMLDSVDKGDGYREVFVKMGTTYSNVLRVQISPFALLAYTTDPDEVSKLEAYYQKSKNHIVAINNYLDEMGKRQLSKKNVKSKKALVK